MYINLYCLPLGSALKKILFYLIFQSSFIFGMNNSTVSTKKSDLNTPNSLGYTKTSTNAQINYSPQSLTTTQTVRVGYSNTPNYNELAAKSHNFQLFGQNSIPASPPAYYSTSTTHSAYSTQNNSSSSCNQNNNITVTSPAYNTPLNDEDFLTENNVPNTSISPLIDAIKNSNRATNINVTNGNKTYQDRLNLAIRKNNIESTQILLTIPNININNQNKDDYTPLHSAVSDNNKVLTQLLLNTKSNPDFNNKVNLDIPCKNGFTPLHTAINKNNKELVDLLINAGANLNTPNKFGITPLEMAINNKNLELIDLLISAYLKQNNSSKDYLMHLIDSTNKKSLHEYPNDIKVFKEIIQLLNQKLNELKSSTATNFSSNQKSLNDDDDYDEDKEFAALIKDIQKAVSAKQ